MAITKSASVLRRYWGEGSLPEDGVSPMIAELTCAQGTANFHPLSRAEQVDTLWGEVPLADILGTKQVFSFLVQQLSWEHEGLENCEHDRVHATVCNLFNSCHSMQSCQMVLAKNSSQYGLLKTFSSFSWTAVHRTPRRNCVLHASWLFLQKALSQLLHYRQAQNLFGVQSALLSCFCVRVQWGSAGLGRLCSEFLSCIQDNFMALISLAAKLPEVYYTHRSG